MDKSSRTKLCMGALGVSLGLTWMIGVVVCGLLSAHYHYGDAWVQLLSSLYLGFDATPKGIMIGALWGFADGFVFGALIAFFYNFTAKKCPCGICCVKE